MSTSISIEMSHQRIQTALAHIEALELKLRNQLSSEMIRQLISHMQFKLQQTLDDSNLRHKKLIERISDRYQSKSLLPDKPKNWVLNLSKSNLKESETQVLEMVLNFASALRIIPNHQILAGLEKGIWQLPPHEADLVRGKVTSLLKSHKAPQPTLSREEREAVYSLKKREDIVIVKADKGNTTVVLDRDEYDDKLMTMLKDTTTYVELKRDPTKKTERVENQFVSQLSEEDKISPTTTHRLKSSDAGSPRRYGLPKIHKANIPLRPIVSFIGSPTYALSKELASILLKLTGLSEHHVKNSEEFVKSVTSIKIEETEILVSFDVISLFTKIPVDLAIKVAQERLHKLQNLQMNSRNGL